jgi:hypothetical protein
MIGPNRPSVLKTDVKSRPTTNKNYFLRIRGCHLNSLEVGLHKHWIKATIISINLLKNGQMLFHDSIHVLKELNVMGGRETVH